MTATASTPRFGRDDLRAASWALRALHTTRRRLRRHGLTTTVPAPPRVPDQAVRGVRAVLRRRPSSCLERALVLQRWLDAHGRGYDVVVGVTGPASGFAAHAWLDGMEAEPDGYSTLHRLPPPSRRPPVASARDSVGRNVAEADGPDDDGASALEEVLAPRPDRSLRRLPRLVVAALRLCWRSARREFAVSSALQLLSGAAVGVQLLLARHVLAELLPAGGGGGPGGAGTGAVVSFGDLVPTLGALCVVGALMSFAEKARLEQQRLLAELVARHAIDRVLDVAGAVDLLDFERPAFHDRLQRAAVNAEIRPYQTATGTLGLVSALFAIVGIGGALLLLQPLFLLLVMGAYVPAWLATVRASRVTHDFSVEQTERDRLRQYLRMVLMGKDEAKELRAFQLNGFLRGRYDRLHDQRLADLRVMVRRRLRLGLAGGLATSCLTAGAVAALVWFVTTGRMDAADAATAAGAVVLLSQRLGGLTSSVGAMYESSLFLEDFTTFVDAAPAIAAARPPAAPPPRFSELAVDRVSFTYPGGQEPSLRHVSLTVRAGEVVALVGPNGSGKTTLAKLLAGLYQPAEGTIRWDGVDASTFDPDLLRANVAIIFQDFVRYFLTVGENIGLGRHERVAEAEALARAAVSAGADEFIQTLRRGYDTRLGPQYDGGTDLSVGQWQRVALARAYFRDAPFLVLDEPTAALDPRGEAELFDGIRGLAAGRAVLLISHRFASVRSADRIYVLREGEVLESGDHVELMGRQGLYAELFDLQASAYGPVTRP